MLDVVLELALLFVVSFLAATIFPAQSEILLVALFKAGDVNALWLFIFASIGNVLGSCLNFVLGRYVRNLKNRKWLKVNPKTLCRAECFYKRYGVWSLLFSWFPVIGDALTVIAGILKVNFAAFLLFVTLGKCARYAFVLYVAGFRF